MIKSFFSIWHAIRKNLTLGLSLPGIAIFISNLPDQMGKHDGKKNPHFLRISGKVPGNKRREFEQTLKSVFKQLPDDCIEYGLSKDVFVEGHYHFFSIWLADTVMKLFMASMEFQLLTGAFYTLGDEEKTVADIQVFRVSNMT